MRPRVVAIEEHYADPQIVEQFPGWRHQPPRIMERLLDFGAMRIREMDEAGIDVQVLSHAPPSVQMLDPNQAQRLASRTNDFLHERVQANPRRFAAFATLPTADPDASVRELERAVTSLGFVGAMIHGLTDRAFIDQKQFWPIFECASAFDVPVYIHPSMPHASVIEAYYKDYPSLARAGWGFGAEMATQALRLILSGIFDVYPRLQIILGHLGEGLPFSIWRANATMNRDAGLKRPVRDYFESHFHVTTSGNFSFPALQCCMLELGIDRIMFAVDWPWAANTEGVNFVKSLPISDADRGKIFCANAERLLKLRSDKSQVDRI